jgi:peptidoglycan/xylan/chitin deacetylase (PgdA/CDA1 family)
MLLIYSSRNSPRLDYTCNFIFSEYSGLAYRISSDLQEAATFQGPVINYSGENLANSLQLIPHGLLFETGIKPQQTEVSRVEGHPVFFSTTGADLPFDLFSAVFFLLARYEEYLLHEPDEHGRFRAQSSLAFREHFLNEPVIETWLHWLRDKLQQKFPGLKFSQRKFSSVSTIDVDQAFCYRHKGALRNISGLLRDATVANIRAVKQRFRVLLGRENDPYDNFDLIIETNRKHGIPLIFFMLLAAHGKYDKGISPGNEALRELVKKLHRSAVTGIHPSYFTMEKEGLLSAEISCLQEITGSKVERSRQHYLRMSLPGTYRMLIENGIKEDHTMGYAAQPGFRAGVSVPFFFFDLENEKQTALRVHPFTIMDVTMRDYLKCSPAEALILLAELTAKVKKVNGTFVSLWHNESLSEIPAWKGWRKVYNEMLEMVSTPHG